MEEFAGLTEWLRRQAPTPTDRLLAKKETEEIGGAERYGFSGLEELNRALVRFQTFGQTFDNIRARRP